MSKAKKIHLSSSGMDIPDFQIEAIARCLLPKIQRYYESADGQKDLTEFRATKARQAKVENNG